MGSNGRINWISMPDWIDVRSASEETGYAVDYLRRLMRQGKIDGSKRGTMWWINRDSLQAYVELIEGLGNKKHDPQGIPRAQEREART